MFFLFVFFGLASSGSAKTRVVMLIQAQDVFSQRAASVVDQTGQQWFAKDAQMEMVDLDQLIAPNQPSEEKKVFEKAKDQLRKGLEAYENLDLNSAVKYLTAASKRFDQVVGEWDRDRLRTQDMALIYLGASWILKGDIEKGQDCFRQVLIFDRHIRMDQNIFSPSLVKAFEEVRKDTMKDPSGTLTVYSTPSFGKVFVDGVFQGVCPQPMQKLTRGDHLVVVRMPMYKPCGKKMRISENEEAVLNCKLVPLPGAETVVEQFTEAISSLDDKSPLPESLQKLFQQGKVDQVVLGKLWRRGQEVQYLLTLFDTSAGSVLRSQEGVWKEGSDDFTKVVGSVFAYLISGQGQIITTGPTDKNKGIGPAVFPEGAPFYKRWYFWTAIGVGVAAATVAIVFLLPQKKELGSQILLNFQ